MLDRNQRERLDRVFNAKSVAVVGAGEVPGKVGYNIIESLLYAGYSGKIYPIHPRLESVLGLRVYRSLRELPEGVELAIIAINQYATVEVLDDCAAKGVLGVVCVAGGFRELGPEGEELEQRLVEKAKGSGLILIGPNTLGFINPWAKINTTFYPMHLKAGSVGLISQSGGMGLTMVYKAFDEDLGLSKWIGCGNRSSLKFSDYLHYLACDPKTKVIGIFLEGTEDAKEMVELAKEIVKEKPIVVYKAGRSHRIDFATVTHTGSMAGSYRVYRDIFEETGILMVDSIEELIAACKALALSPLPPRDGIGILTHTAGPSIIVLDELLQRGCRVPPWKEGTIRAVEEILEGNPPTVIKNPLDVPGAGFDCVTYGRLAQKLLEDEGTGSLLCIFTHNRLWRFPSAELIDLSRHQPKPLLAYFVSPSEGVKEERRWLQSQGIPVYTDPHLAAVGLFALHHRRQVLVGDEDEGQRPEFPDLKPYFQKALREGRRILTEVEGKALLSALGVSVPRWREVSSEEEAVAAALEMGFPVVLKVLSPKIVHKTEVGGVRLNLSNPDEVRCAWREMMESVRPLDPYARATVQEMAPEGMEVIVGLTTDPHFGRVLMFGLGGVFAEVLEDVVFCLPPISPRKALRLMKRLKASQVLFGHRRKDPMDVEALAELISLLSHLVVAYPEVVEMDLNPVALYPKGLKVLDARLRLSD